MTSPVVIFNIRSRTTAVPYLLFDLEIRLSFVWSTEVTKDNPFYLRDCRATSSAIRDTPRTTSTRYALL